MVKKRSVTKKRKVVSNIRKKISSKKKKVAKKSVSKKHSLRRKSKPLSKKKKPIRKPIKRSKKTLKKKVVKKNPVKKGVVNKAVPRKITKKKSIKKVPVKKGVVRKKVVAKKITKKKIIKKVPVKKMVAIKNSIKEKPPSKNISNKFRRTNIEYINSNQKEAISKNKKIDENFLKNLHSLLSKAEKVSNSSKPFSVRLNLDDLVDFRELVKSQTKFAVEINAIKDRENFTLQQIKHLIEDVANLKAIISNKDKQISSLSSDVNALKNKLRYLNPDKLSQKVDRIREDALSYPSRFKVLESQIKSLLKNSDKNKETIVGIKNVKSFIKQFNKTLFKNLSKMERLKLDAQKYSEISEKSYDQLNMNIRDVNILEKKITEFEEKIQKMVNNIESSHKEEVIGSKSEGISKEVGVIDPEKSKRDEKIRLMKKKIAGWKAKGIDVSALEKEVDQYE